MGIRRRIKITPSNSLVLNHPEVVNQWHPTRNADKNPENYTKGSKVWIWWKCLKGDDHTFRARIHNRTSFSGRNKHPTSCPYCDGKKVSKDNNLLFLFPEVAKLWHPTKNGEFKPQDVVARSGIKRWWKCPKGEDHEWEEQPNMLTSSENFKGYGCPFCAGHRVSVTNSFAILYPNLLKAWHPTKNGNKKPGSYTYGSNVKIWWTCPRDSSHDYTTSICERTIRSSGCGKCTNQTSRNEVRIFTECLYFFKNTKWRDKKEGSEIDVFIPELNIGIEYDGKYWHEDSKKGLRDFNKNKKMNLLLDGFIRVREEPLPCNSLGDISCTQKPLIKKDLNKIFTKLYELLNLEPLPSIKEYLLNKSFVNEKEFNRILSYLPSPPPEESFLHKSPDSVEFFDYQKNYPLRPEYFRFKSQKKVWWRCTKSKEHNFERTFEEMRRTNSCPFCTKRRASADYNLEIINPELAKQWHPTKNGSIKPHTINPRSNTERWWLCDCGYEWKSSPDIRTLKKGGAGRCPSCLNGQNIQHQNPQLAKQWHPTKNGALKAHMITPGSDIERWWLCNCGYEWKSSPQNRSDVRTRKGIRKKGAIRRCPSCHH
jgi:hypothetical protein